MLSNLQLKNHNKLLNQEKSILPLMTVAFINCLDSENRRFERAHRRHQRQNYQHQTISIVSSPTNATPSEFSNDQIFTISSRHDRRSAEKVERTTRPLINHGVVRNLIECISHNFNNLLMGIWGNITLLRMHYDQTHPIGHQLLKMEQLIESGAFLVHMVLGYLGERRMAARRLRLDQIVQELMDAGYRHPISMDRYRLKKRLIRAADIQHPPMIAGSTAKVLDILLRSLSHHRQKFSTVPIGDIAIEKKITHIDTLILNGKNLVNHLSLYAGEMKPDLVTAPLKPVLADVLRELVEPHSNLKLLLKDLPDQSRMHMDRAMVSSALREVMGYTRVDLPRSRYRLKCASKGFGPIHIVCGSGKSIDHVAIRLQIQNMPLSRCSESRYLICIGSTRRVRIKKDWHWLRQLP